ncbi:hypothetical protein FB451DRAFT_1398896 [Mycena latifolia]|nr:hypothetical protein FB451DRAFT_1398896 [Mycena latifolia]
MTIHFIAFLNRLPHVSFEEFDRHWGEIHCPLIEALPAVKSGLVKYRQFHVSPETNARLAGMGLSVLPHDGVAQWSAERVEDILELFTSKELIETVIPDEKHFFERKQCTELFLRARPKYARADSNDVAPCL